MSAICEFNILHVCDYEGPYTNLSPFVDYPGHVVNVNPQVGPNTLSGQEITDMFGRPFMGGLDRHGIITTGTQEEIRGAVNSICEQAPSNFILGADCTLPSDINWENIKIAIDAAHQFER